MQPRKIPVTVIITTKNEERNLPRCLSSVADFGEVIVVDSASTDTTREIAQSFGATVVPFSWNGQYPKKRQWCLDSVPTEHEWIFFLDADEEVTPAFMQKMAAIDCDGPVRGYFVRAAYVIDGKALRHGLKNSKLCLFDKTRFHFPVVDDLDLPGMGEMEGHYQPQPISEGTQIGTLRNVILHHALEDEARWNARHEGYAKWQEGMLRKRALPQDPSALRDCIKTLFYKLPIRPWIAFLHSYMICLGFLDGYRGFILARSRFMYYRK